MPLTLPQPFSICGIFIAGVGRAKMDLTPEIFRRRCLALYLMQNYVLWYYPADIGCVYSIKGSVVHTPWTCFYTGFIYINITSVKVWWKYWSSYVTCYSSWWPCVYINGFTISYAGVSWISACCEFHNMNIISVWALRDCMKMAQWGKKGGRVIFAKSRGGRNRCEVYQ